MTQLTDPLAALPARWRLAVRAVRGATTVAADEPVLVRGATIELLGAVLLANRLPAARIVSAIFTVTPDLCSEFPARAARELGWHDVPLLCVQEIPVPGALPRCIRVLLHVACARPRSRIRHVYLHDASVLRPDLRPDLRGVGERAPRAPRGPGRVRLARPVQPAAASEGRR